MKAARPDSGAGAPCVGADASGLSTELGERLAGWG